MTASLGRPVSRAMLDKWTSEGSTEHRIPLDAYIALVEATGAVDLVGFIAEQFGLVAIPERYQAIVELHLVEEHEAAVRARKDVLNAKLRGRR